MSSFSGCLVAALLAAPTGAAASLILTPPQEVLERRTETFDASRRLGPKIQYTVGEKIEGYPASAEHRPHAQEMTAFGITFSAGALVLLVCIPVLQRAAVRLRLLD